MGGANEEVFDGAAEAAVFHAELHGEDAVADGDVFVVDEPDGAEGFVGDEGREGVS